MQWAGLPAMSWQCVELFSGCGNVSACFRRAGKAVASFDKLLGDKAMDITKAAGFLFGAQLPTSLKASKPSKQKVSDYSIV